jgi:hypothetical protein
MEGGDDMDWKAREEIERYDPRRPVDWCWRAAHRIIDERRSNRGNPRIVEAVRFLRALNRCKHDHSRDAVRRRRPGIAGAYRLHEQGGCPLWEVQARILAGQSDEAIALSCGVSAEVVDWYESLFFQIRANLDCHDWIHIRAIGTHVAEVVKYPDLPTLWRGMAYLGGEFVLEVVMAVTLGEPLPDGVRERPRADQEAFEERLRLKVKLMIDLLMLPADTDPGTILTLDLEHRQREALGEERYPLTEFADRLKTLVGEPGLFGNLRASAAGDATAAA